MSEVATQLRLKDAAQMAFAAIVIANYKDAFPDASMVKVVDARTLEAVPDDQVGGLVRCEVKFAGWTYIGTIFQKRLSPKEGFVRLNQIHTPAGKFFPGHSCFMHDMAEDYFAVRKKRTG